MASKLENCARFAVLILFITDGFSSLGSLAAVAPSPSPVGAPYARDRVLVQLNADVVMANSEATLGLEYSRNLADGVDLYKITDGSTVSEKVAALSSNEAVVSVEPDYLVTVNSVPDDSLYSQQWHHPVISTPAAWGVVESSESVKICVVDSGARIDHPDLAGNIAGGWNLVPTNQVSGAATPGPGDAAYTNFNDTFGHGTHTAGIAAAVGNNRRGVAGVNWKVKLYICKFIWDDGSGYISDAITCQSLCRNAGAQITSNSWGGIPYSSFLDNALQAVSDAGTLFVGSSGNTGTDLDDSPLYPASYSKAGQISVASTGTEDLLSSFSTYGANTVSLAAPGESILSTTSDAGYGTMSGTSMACPMVAGAAALLQAAAYSRGANLTSIQLKAYLMANVDAVGDTATKTLAGGRLNVAKALAAVLRDISPAISPIAAASLNSTSPSPSPSPSPSTSPKPSPPPSPKPSPPPSPKPSPPPSPSPSPSPSTTSPPPPPPPSTSPYRLGACGTTSIKGSTAWMSSTAAGSSAADAVDGDCRANATSRTSPCAVSTAQDDPWLAIDSGSSAPWLSVGIKPRSDCGSSGCWTDLSGAQVLVGATRWNSASSLSNFTLCGTVPANVQRGSRIAIRCASRPSGRYLAVYLPKDNVSLTICELDAARG